MGETCYPLSDAGSSITARMSPLRPPPDRFDYLPTPSFSVWRSYAPFSNRRREMAFSENSRGFSPDIELLPFFHSEAQLQRAIDAADNVYTIAWKVLRVAQSFYGATLFLGGTAVTAPPPFFDIAGRKNVLYWHPDPTRLTCQIGDDPLVVTLADFTDNEFDEVYAPHLSSD
jgi:hypothetical protein